ncbi:MAG: hypothetical protein M3Z57_01445 [Candidatus Dormibacteraeota bacterium]|nr:hypothetical protein [Candidatus Dormibacteraeota bacterium]
MISPAPPLPGSHPGTQSTSEWAPEVSLRGRLLAVRRRRMALRVRDWLGIGVIATFSVTLFAVTFFSLVAR